MIINKYRQCESQIESKEISELFLILRENKIKQLRKIKSNAFSYSYK